jgi:hypothetical protein
MSPRAQLRGVGAVGVEVRDQTVPHSDDNQRADFEISTAWFPKGSLFRAQNEHGSSKRKVTPVRQERFESLSYVIDDYLSLVFVEAKGEELRSEYRLRVF